MRGHLLEALWRQDEPHIYVNHDEYMSSFEGWDVQPYESDGKLVGVTMVKGPEFHFSTFEKFNITRSDIRKCLTPILEKYGFVLTKTPHEAVRQQRFNKIIGFFPVGEDQFYIHFKLEHLRHA